MAYGMERNGNGPVNANVNANLSAHFNFQQSARRLRVPLWCELSEQQAEAVHPSSSHAARNGPGPQDQPEAGTAPTTMGLIPQQQQQQQQQQHHRLENCDLHSREAIYEMQRVRNRDTVATANSQQATLDCRLPTADCGLRTARGRVNMQAEPKRAAAKELRSQRRRQRLRLRLRLQLQLRRMPASHREADPESRVPISDSQSQSHFKSKTQSQFQPQPQPQLNVFITHGQRFRSTPLAAATATAGGHAPMLLPLLLRLPPSSSTEPESSCTAVR
ncbi:hypothetical protein AWZ03_010246 [Drosophila navojoa]|uniref:Uncharacterized protein n=1 Tax=Drosophila navojoa TaxID=7232 RepID=A0A484B381_DRONA|nr:hypothetical protein AWZ03_010246 [Drosophila navojoa]